MGNNGFIQEAKTHASQRWVQIKEDSRGSLVRKLPTVLILSIAISAASCATAPQLGGGPTMVTGTSNLYGGVGYAPQLVQCD